MEQYVMTTGTIRTPLLYAHNLDSLLMVSFKSRCSQRQQQLMCAFSIEHISFLIYTPGAVVLPTGSFDGELSIVLTDVVCQGNEESILQCPESTGTDRGL